MYPKIVKIGHVGLTVRDIDASVAFYCRYLGMKLTEKFDYGEARDGHGSRVQAGAFVRCNSAHHELSIFKMRDSEQIGSGECYGLHHIAFELGSKEELLQLYQTFREGGVPIVNARTGGPGNQPRFYAKDPDGNLLEFYFNIDHVGWTGVARPYDPIQEIDLAKFDFEAHEARREADGESFRERFVDETASAEAGMSEGELK